jgi:hypothetical protein
MPTLRYPYFTYPGAPRPRPVISVHVSNPLTGLSAEFVGIIDSGADSIVLTEDIAKVIGVKTDGLPIYDVGGVHGISGAYFCDYLTMSAIDVLGKEHYPINYGRSIPVYISQGGIFCLMGQRSFLEQCICILDAPNKLTTLQF